MHEDTRGPLPRRSRRIAGVLGVLLALEVLAIVLWFRFADWSILRPASVAHPLVWLNIAAFALLVTDRPAARRRDRFIAILVALCYLVVLGWVAGAIKHGMGAYDLTIIWLPPGWGPAVQVSSPWVRATLFPYQVVGYVTLAYLLYVGILDAVRPVAGALLGVASCIGCTLPLAATVLPVIFGGTAPLSVEGVGRPAAIGTLVFALAVAILLWRPASVAD
jgi:hypothetical protein